MSQRSRTRLSLFIAFPVAVLLGAVAADARPRATRVDPAASYFIMTQQKVSGRIAVRGSSARRRNFGRRQELQRELRGMLPPVAAFIRAAALPPNTKLQRELQRELHRMPQPPAIAESLACAERLARVAHYEPLPSRSGPGECSAVDLVLLELVVMPDHGRVTINPPAKLRCGMAEAVADWVRDDIGPAADDLGAPLAGIEIYASYDCRTRNGVRGAKVSEHGKGNALDVGAIKLRNGGIFKLADPQVSKSVREKLRQAACSRFMTVLGPGSDSYHEQHVHVDLAERSHRNHICQWDLRSPTLATKPPIPLAKPKSLTVIQAGDANAQALVRPRTKTAPTQRRRRRY